MQRLRHRLQAGERRPVGSEPPPRGDDQRWRARRAFDLGGVHALLGRAVHGRVPGRLLLPQRGRRRAARQGPVHRLRLLLLRVPVRRPAVPAGGCVRRPRQDGQVHVLRGRSGERQFRGGVQEVRPQSAGRGQAAGVRGDVLDQGVARRRWRHDCRDLPAACVDARQRQRSVGLVDGLRASRGAQVTWRTRRTRRRAGR